MEQDIFKVKRQMVLSFLSGFVLSVSFLIYNVYSIHCSCNTWPWEQWIKRSKPQLSILSQGHTQSIAFWESQWCDRLVQHRIGFSLGVGCMSDILSQHEYITATDVSCLLKIFFYTKWLCNTYLWLIQAVKYDVNSI